MLGSKQVRTIASVCFVKFWNVVSRNYLCEYSDKIDEELLQIFDIVKGAVQSIHSRNSQDFRNTWKDSLLVMRYGKLETELEERLFTFIEASRNKPAAPLISIRSLDGRL